MSEFLDKIRANEVKAGAAVATLWSKCQEEDIPTQMDEMQKLLIAQGKSMGIPEIKVSENERSRFFEAIEKRYKDTGIPSQIVFTAVYNAMVQFAWSHKKEEAKEE